MQLTLKEDLCREATKISSRVKRTNELWAKHSRWEARELSILWWIPFRFWNTFGYDYELNWKNIHVYKASRAVRDVEVMWCVRGLILRFFDYILSRYLFSLPLKASCKRLDPGSGNDGANSAITEARTPRGLGTFNNTPVKKSTFLLSFLSFRWIEVVETVLHDWRSNLRNIIGGWTSGPFIYHRFGLR